MKQKLLLFLSLTLPLTATLISLQILAPDRFKPLTNRLLDYPHVTPSINLERGVFQTSFSPSHTASDISLHSYRSIQALLPQPLTIAKVVDDVYVPPKSSAPAPKKSTSAPRGSVTRTLKQEIQDIISNTPPAAPAIVVQPPKPIDERDDTPAPAPQTPAAPAIISPKQVLDEARQETYLTNYGAEAGRYGWNYDTGKPATTNQWNDPNARIAGTYIGPNGQRYTVNLESTKQAESSFVNAIANKISTLSNDQVLDYAKELPGNVSCSAADITCQQQLIKDTLAIIGQQSVSTRAIDQNLTTAIQDAQQQNAAFQAKIATFLDPNSSREKILNCAVGNTSCRETTYEDYLKQLGVDKDSIPTLLADRQTNIQNQARIKKFYDPTASTADILECSPGVPKCGGKTLESFLANLNVDSDKIPDLIKERSTNIANYQTDLKLISKFADALISTSDLAKEVCSGDFGCVKDFNREDYLGSLHYQELAGNAKSAYQLSLFNFSKLVDEPSFKDLPATTQNTLLNANTSVQQAFAAYSFEHNQTPGTIVTPESSNQLALDFANKIESNPDIIKEYSAKFADHKDLYQGLIDTTRLFALTEGEKNAVAVAQLKDIATHTTIAGLANKGEMLPWDKVSTTYKNEARNLACKSSDALYEACSFINLNTGTPDPNKQKQIEAYQRQIDQTLIADAPQYLQQIYDKQTGANIQLSTSFSNVATVNNPLVDQQLVTKAIQFANQKADPNVPAYMTEQHYNPDFTPLTETEKTQLANEYLDRQLVTETYKVGAGVAAGTAGFIGGMALCSLAGPGALVCGAIGGISGVLASQIPLREMTAQQYQEQRQNQLGGITKNSDLAGSVIQNLYSSQGAWGDEGMGRSITTRNNQFALYDAINAATNGQTIAQIRTDSQLQANLAIQGQVLNQWEVNQNRQESWTYTSLPIAGLTGALNVGLGQSLATTFTNNALKASAYTAGRLATDASLFAGSSVLNLAQTAAQFNTTGGDISLLTTEKQIDYQTCVMSKGTDACADKLPGLNTETSANRVMAMQQAFITDTLTQVIQTGFAARSYGAEFDATLARANQLGIETTGHTIGDVTTATQAKLTEIATTLKIKPADLARLNNTELQGALAAAELTTNIPKIDQTQPISTDGLSELLMSKKVVQTEENGKPRLAFDQTHAPTSEETAVMTHVNNLLGVMEKTSGFDAIFPEQLGAVTLSLDALATQKIAKTNSPDSLLLDQSVKPGVNPDAKTGGGKNTVIVPLLEKIALDGGQLTLHLAPEANMAGNRQTIENLRAFYDTDIYVAVNQKNAAGAVTDRYFTNLDGTRLPTETVLARIQQDGKAPMILADADTAMFALNEVIKIERGLAKSDSISSVWEKIWNSGPTITADEVGTLSGHWQTTLGDPVAIAKLRKSQASLHLNDGAEVLSIYHATGDLEIIRQARSGELVLEKNPANRSLKPLSDEHTNQIIDISLEHAGSDKKIPSALKDELGRIQSLSNLDEKRHAFDTLRKHTPIELDTIYGKNASHAVALANAYNDAIYSRLSIIADIPGNDFRTVSGSVGTTIELAEGKTITGQQYSEVMLKLALQDEGSRALSIADTQLVPLDQLSIASQAVVVDLNDMFSHAGSMIGYDATDRLATAKTGLHAIYESTQLHAPKSVSLAQTLPETAVATARLVRDQFDQGKTALVIETNINKYSLDDATTAHTAAALKQLRPGESLYLALDNGDGSYQLYKVKGPDRTTWDLITGTPKSAEELYLASRTAIDADSTNNRLLALFENKTRGENFKPQTGIAPDIKESIVIGNPDTSISDTTQQGAGRVRVGGNDPAAEYHFVAYVDNQDTFNQLNSVSLTKPQDLPGIILSHLEQNQARTEGYISLERNIKAINDGQVSNLIVHLYQDAQNNPKLIAQLAELENQIKNSGLAFATTPAEESTANALHDQYLFTRGRIENILTIAEQNGVPTQKISSLRITFNLDEPTLPLSSFAGMLKPNFDNSDLTGYHLALAKNIGTFENVPEKYLAGSPTQPVKSIASTLQPTTTSSLTSRVSTWIQAQIPTSIPLASSIASLVNYPTNLLATALRTASSIINPTIPVLNNQPIVNLLALPDTTLSFLTNDNQAIAFFRVNNTLYYQTDDSEPISLTTTADALAYLPSPDTITRIVLNDEDLDPSTYRAPGNLLSDSPITKTPGEPIDLRNVGLITSTKNIVQNILSQLSISPADTTIPSNAAQSPTLSDSIRQTITDLLRPKSAIDPLADTSTTSQNDIQATNFTPKVANFTSTDQPINGGNISAIYASNENQNVVLKSDKSDAVKWTSYILEKFGGTLLPAGYGVTPGREIAMEKINGKEIGNESGYMDMTPIGIKTAVSQLRALLESSLPIGIIDIYYADFNQNFLYERNIMVESDGTIRLVDTTANSQNQATETQTQAQIDSQIEKFEQYLNNFYVRKLQKSNQTQTTPQDSTPPKTPGEPIDLRNVGLITSTQKFVQDTLTQLSSSPVNITIPTNNYSARISANIKDQINQLLNQQEENRLIASSSISFVVNSLLNPLENLSLIKGNPEVKATIAETIRTLNLVGLKVKTNKGRTPTLAHTLVEALSSKQTQASLSKITNPVDLEHIAEILAKLGNTLQTYTLTAQEALLLAQEATKITDQANQLPKQEPPLQPTILLSANAELENTIKEILSSSPTKKQHLDNAITSLYQTFEDLTTQLERSKDQLTSTESIHDAFTQLTSLLDTVTTDPRLSTQINEVNSQSSSPTTYDLFNQTTQLLNTIDSLNLYSLISKINSLLASRLDPEINDLLTQSQNHLNKLNLYHQDLQEEHTHYRSRQEDKLNEISSKLNYIESYVKLPQNTNNKILEYRSIANSLYNDFVNHNHLDEQRLHSFFRSFQEFNQTINSYNFTTAYQEVIGDPYEIMGPVQQIIQLIDDAQNLENNYKVIVENYSSQTSLTYKTISDLANYDLSSKHRLSSHNLVELIHDLNQLNHKLASHPLTVLYNSINTRLAIGTPFTKRALFVNTPAIQDLLISIYDKRAKGNLVFTFKLTDQEYNKANENFSQHGRPSTIDFISSKENDSQSLTLTEALEIKSHNASIKLSTANRSGQTVIAAQNLVQIELPNTYDQESFLELASTLDSILSEVFAINNAFTPADTNSLTTLQLSQYANQHKASIELLDNEQVLRARATELSTVYPHYQTFVDQGQYLRLASIAKYATYHSLSNPVDLVNVLLHGGLMATSERYGRGTFTEGMSSMTDTITGGADSVFTRTIVDGAAGSEQEMLDNNIHLIFTPTLLDRMDWYAYSSDKFGSKEPSIFQTRQTPEELITDQLEKGFNSSNEQMFSTGIDTQYIAKIAVNNNQLKTTLVTLLNEIGITQINGVSTEQMIIVTDTIDSFTSYAWDHLATADNYQLDKAKKLLTDINDTFDYSKTDITSFIENNSPALTKTLESYDLNSSDYNLYQYYLKELAITLLSSSQPKSAQQAALDALLGRTMGISAIPDFTEIGQNLAIWFDQKYGDLIGKGKRETTDNPTSTIQPISSEMTQILLSPLSDWFSSKSGLVDTYLSTKYKTGFSKTYLQQVKSTVQILNQVIPGKDAEILTINSPLSDIANKTNNLLEEEFVKDVRLSGNRALSQIKANHPSQIIEEIVSAPELLFNSKGQRVSMEEYLQDRYSELLTRGVKISINYLDAQEAINASGIEGSKLNLYDDVVSGLQSLGIKIPIIVVVTPEGKQYNIPLVNDPIDLDRLGAYGAFSSFVDSGGLLLRGRVKLIASSLHNIDDPADTNLLGSLTTILHELDHVIYGSIKSSHILSLKDERDLLSNKLTDHVANAKIILNSRDLTDLIKLLDKTNLEIIRVNHNDQDFAILLNRAKQVQRDIVQLAYGGNSQEYIDYQEVESLAEVKSSEYILSSVQYQNLDPVIAEGLSTRSEEAFLTIQKYYLKSSKVNSYELIKLFDFIINHTIIMRNSSSASQAIYGVGYDLITTPSDNPVLASANIYLDNLTAKYIQQSPQLFIAAIQYNINKAIDINEILYPNLSPNERAQENQKIISAMLHNPDIFAIINQENLSIMSTAYDQYRISTKQEKAQIIASLENQIKADSNEEMISQIKLKAQEDDNYFEALLSYVHTIIPLKTFTENILSSKYDFSSELANLQDYVQNAPVSPHSLTPLLPSSPKSAQQAALDALLGRTMGISAIPASVTEWVSDHYQNYKLNQWKNRAGEALTEDQKTEVINTLKAEPNGKQLISVLVSHRTPQVYLSELRFPDDNNKVAALIQVVTLARTIQIAQPSTNTHNLMNNLLNEYSHIKWDKIQPHSAQLSNILLSNNPYATTELFERLSNSDLDLETAIPTLTIISELLKNTSHLDTWDLVSIIGETPTQSTLDTLVTNLNPLGQILRAIPKQNTRNRVIQDGDLFPIIHDISEKDNAADLFSQILLHIDDLVKSSQTFNNRLGSYYSGEAMVAGLKSPNLKTYLNRLTNLTVPQHHHLTVIFNNIHNLGVEKPTKKQSNYVDSGVTETLRVFTLNDNPDETLNFLDEIVKETDSLLLANNSFEKQTYLLETLKIINPDNFSPSRILWIFNLLKAEPNVSKYGIYPKAFKIWATMNNDEQFATWLEAIKNTPNLFNILYLSALDPSLAPEILTAINHLSQYFPENTSINISYLLQYSWHNVFRDKIPTVNPNDIIDLSKNIETLELATKNYPGETGKFLIINILEHKEALELARAISRHPSVFRPLFLASDTMGVVESKLQTIANSDTIRQGIQQIRLNNLQEIMNDSGVNSAISKKIMDNPPTISGSATYELIRILNLYNYHNTSYRSESNRIISDENLPQLSNYLSSLFPQITSEHLSFLTRSSSTSPSYLLFLVAFKNQLLPIFSQPVTDPYPYHRNLRVFFFDLALSHKELWKSTHMNDITSIATLTESQLATKIVTKLTTDHHLEAAWDLLKDNNGNEIVKTLPSEQQRFWQIYYENPLLRKRWLEPDGIQFFYTLSAEQVSLYTTLATKIEESPVAFIQKIKESLIAQLLTVNDPVATYENIDRTLTHNNLPEFIKLIKVFNYLYPKNILNPKISFRTSPSIQAQKSDGMRRLMLQLDLFHAAVESGNRNLESYLSLFNDYANLVDQFMQGKELDPQEIKQVISFITKMDALYRSSNLTRIRSGLDLDLQQTSNQTYLRTFIQDSLYTDLDINQNTSLVGRIEELFLHNTGYVNLKDILAHMQSLRAQTTSRNLAYASTHPQLTLDAGDLMKAMVTSPKTGVILSILENGPRARELMGDLAGNDSTALDTDLSMVTTADAQSGYKTIMEQSKADTTYGSLIFVTKNIPGRFYRSDLGETSSKGQFELFITAVTDAERHVGIRGAYPSSYFDAIINNGFTESELDTLYQSITLNGFYIPVYSKEGQLIFTPQMYADRLKFFAGVHEESFQIIPLSPQDPFSKIIQQNQLSPDLAANTKDIERVETPVRLRIKEVLTSLGISLADDPSSANLTDALLINIGSSGRGTNLPKDYDFDYTLVLNRRDYNKAAAITAALRNIFPHDSETGSSANQVRLSQVNMVETTETIDLDIGIVTREDSMLYSSNQAVKDRLNSLSDNAKRQAIANILLTKKLLKDSHAYKAYEDGGFGGIGVENWILSNNGNIRQAFETFWSASHDKQGNQLTFQEFQRNYPIYDPGTNLRDQKFDNYVYKLQENGYQNMLEVINQHLRLPQKLVEKATNLGQQIGQTITDLTAINPDISTLVKWNLIDYQKTGGNQGGGNEGMLVKKSDTGETWYIKFHEDSEFLANEVLMDKIYEKAGIPVVESVLINIETENGMHIGRASKWVDSSDPRISLDYRDGFIIDAWLANFDGQYEKNRLGAIRVDNGSSLLFKSLGVRKNARYLTSEVSELKSMRSGYPGINDEMIITQINQLTSTMTDEVIKSLVEQSTLSYKDKQTLSRLLIQRRNYFQQYIKTSQKSSLLPLPALTGLGARAGGSILSAISSSPLVSLLPNLPLLTYNTKTWIDNLGLVPAWIKSILPSPQNSNNFSVTDGTSSDFDLLPKNLEMPLITAQNNSNDEISIALDPLVFDYSQVVQKVSQGTARLRIIKNNQGNILGFTIVSPDENLSVIEMIWVNPQYREMGLGEKLLQDAVQILPLGTITMDIWGGDLMTQLATKLGFKQNPGGNMTNRYSLSKNKSLPLRARDWLQTLLGGGRAKSVIINSFNAIVTSASVILAYLQTGKSRLDSSVGQAMQPLAEKMPSFIYDHMGNANDLMIGLAVLAPIIFMPIEMLIGLGQIFLSSLGMNLEKFTNFKTKFFEKLPLILSLVGLTVAIDVETTQYIKTILQIQHSTPDLLDIPAGIIATYGGYIAYKYINTLLMKEFRVFINQKIINAKNFIPNLFKRITPYLKNLLLKFRTPVISLEFLAGWIMIWIEMYHESLLHPQKPLYNLLYATPDQVPSLPTDPFLAWIVDNIGDIQEISLGFMAARVGLVILNEISKIEIVKKYTRGWQFSDKASFWISLGTIVFIKAIHSLGYISLFGIHDHMDHPVPGMLFGQGVAAVVLIGARYLGLYIGAHKNDFDNYLRKLFKEIKS